MYLLLYILWVALNGKITAEICLLGILIVGIVGVIAYALFRYTPRTEVVVYKLVPLSVVYVAVLIWEIVKANFAVLRFIVSEKGAIEPALMSFDVDLKTEAARFVLANSITLTPGTITVLTNDNRFTVHALSSEMLEGVENSSFVKLLQRMEA